MTKDILIRHFWILYFAALGTEVDDFIDKLDYLALQIDQDNPQCEEALDYFETNFIKIMVETNDIPPYFSHN